MMRWSESPEAHTVKPSSHQRLHFRKLSQRSAVPPRMAIPIAAQATISGKAAVPCPRLESSPVSTTAIDLLRGIETNVSHYGACLSRSVAVPMKQAFFFDVCPIRRHPL